MNCPTCATENREGARFCRHCGTSLVEMTSPVAAEGTPETEPQAQPEAEAEAPQEAGTPAAAMEVTGEDDAAGAASEPAEAQPSEDSEGASGPGPAATAPAEEPATEPQPDLPPPPELEAHAALEPGAVIAGRYVVLDVDATRPDEILYRTRDLKRCWQCGFVGDSPDEAFCAQCGAALSRKTDALLLEVRDAAAEPTTGDAVVDRLSEEGRAFLVLAGAEREPVGAPTSQELRLLVGQRSDVGCVRELNEDGLLTLLFSPCYESRTAPVLGLFAVADGMGGHEGGEIASKLALQVLAREVIRHVILPETAGTALPEESLVTALREAAAEANDAVFLARQKRENDMGTTLTAALVRDDRLFLAHVGDSRAYHWSAGGLVQLTLDHSVIASMVASGRAQPEEIYTHPQRSVVYRSVGDRPVVEVDTATLSLSPGDHIVVCSDGLWEMIRSEGIQDVLMQEAEPQPACDLLVKRARAAGGEDNISVVVVRLALV